MSVLRGVIKLNFCHSCAVFNQYRYYYTIYFSEKKLSPNEYNSIPVCSQTIAEGFDIYQFKP